MNGRTANKVHREARLAAFTILSEIQHEPFWKVRLPMRCSVDSRTVFAGAVLASISGKCPADCQGHVDLPPDYCNGPCPATFAECWTRLIERQGIDGAEGRE